MRMGNNKDLIPDEFKEFVEQALECQYYRSSEAMIHAALSTLCSSTDTGQAIVVNALVDVHTGHIPNVFTVIHTALKFLQEQAGPVIHKEYLRKKGKDRINEYHGEETRNNEKKLAKALL